MRICWTGIGNYLTSIRIQPQRGGGRLSRCIALRIIPGLLLLVLVWPVTGGSSIVPTEQVAAEPVHHSGDFVILEPDTWVGKRFPLLEYLDHGDELEVGQWLAVLYVFDCPPCRAHMPDYERMARGQDPRGDGRRITLIEVPPYAPDQWDPVRADTRCHRVRLASEIEWFVQTPLEVWLRDGLVLSVRHD